MPYPSWNKNEGANVVCWLCEHFQRRDNTPGTSNCQGECRKSPLERSAGARNDTADSNGEVKSAFAFVPFGNTTWCSGFQRSLEENIPLVAEGKDNCADQGWADWVTPHENMTFSPPRLNKKSIEDTCWYCEHFQRDPENQGSGALCSGFCCIDPPLDFQVENVDWTGTGFNRIEYAWEWPMLQNAAYMWCSKWERSREPVPDPPEQGGVPCQAPG